MLKLLCGHLGTHSLTFPGLVIVGQQYDAKKRLIHQTVLKSKE